MIPKGRENWVSEANTFTSSFKPSLKIWNPTVMKSGYCNLMHEFILHFKFVSFKIATIYKFYDTQRTRKLTARVNHTCKFLKTKLENLKPNCHEVCRRAAACWNKKCTCSALMKSGYCNLMHEFILHCIIKLANATQMECNEVWWEQKNITSKQSSNNFTDMYHDGYLHFWSFTLSELLSLRKKVSKMCRRGFLQFYPNWVRFCRKLQTALKIWILSLILRVQYFSLKMRNFDTHTHTFVTYFSATVNTFCFDVRSKFSH